MGTVSPGSLPGGGVSREGAECRSQSRPIEWRPEELSVTFRTPMDPRCLLRVDDAVHLASTCIRPYVRPPAPGDRLSWEARGPGY